MVYEGRLKTKRIGCLLRLFQWKLPHHYYIIPGF